MCNWKKRGEDVIQESEARAKRSQWRWDVKGRVLTIIGILNPLARNTFILSLLTRSATLKGFPGSPSSNTVGTKQESRPPKIFLAPSPAWPARRLASSNQGLSMNKIA